MREGRWWQVVIQKRRDLYSGGLYRAITPFSSCSRVARLTRASTKRSRIWTMTPRCFFSMGGIGPRRTGGEIFSNVKAGIVYPLFVELRHSWNSPVSSDERLAMQTVPPGLTQ